MTRLARFVGRLCPIALLSAALILPGCESFHQKTKVQTADWDRARVQVKARLAMDELSAGHIPEATGALNEALRIRPSDPDLRVLQARLQLASGDLAAAQQTLMNLTGDAGQRGDVAYLLGVIDQQRQQTQSALEHFGQAAQRDPNDIAAHVAIVQTLLADGRTTDAQNWLTAIEPRFGWTPAYLAAAAECAEQAGAWSAATADWRRLLDGHDDPEINERLAIAAHHAGLWSQSQAAIEAIRQHSQDTPLPGYLCFLLADCQFRLSEFDSAEQSLALVLRTSDHHVAALELLIEVLSRQAKWGSACRVADELVAVDTSCTALDLAAAVKLRAGDSAGAIALARRGVASDPANFAAQQIVQLAQGRSQRSGDVGNSGAALSNRK